MRPETLYHLQRKSDATHHFSGSISGLFDLIESDQLHLTPKKLYYHDWTEPFENDYCKIVKTSVYRKKHRKND